jgi:hypothetical protein
MNFAEFWILESAIEFRIPLSRLVGPPADAQCLWNKPYHGCSRTEMTDLLTGLLAEGDIVVSVGEEEVQNPTRAQIHDWLSWRRPQTHDPYCSLTTQGGERWAKFSNADWTRHHTYEWDWDFDDYLEIGALTSAIADRAFGYVPDWNELRVFPETITRREQARWNATYWKVFPIGHVIRFKTEYLSRPATCEVSLIRDFRDRQVYAEYEHFSKWYECHPDTPRA